MGGIDISPVILLLGIFLVQQIIILYLYPIASSEASVGCGAADDERSGRQDRSRAVL